jgi:hypothetical protein
LYKSELFINDEKFAEGTWVNKKKAQESAAKQYYQRYNKENFLDNHFLMKFSIYFGCYTEFISFISPRILIYIYSHTIN